MIINVVMVCENIGMGEILVYKSHEYRNGE